MSENNVGLSASLLPLHGTAHGDRLTNGAALAPGQSLVSASGKYELAFQRDGNLVVYNRDPAARDKALWEIGTDSGRGHTCVGAEAVMQADGNFVVYNAQKKACWASNTNGHAGAFVVMQDDGNAVIYDHGVTPNPSGKGAHWDTRTTGGHKPPSSNILKTAASIVKPFASAVTDTENLVGKIPVVGPVLKAQAAPFTALANIAQGERIDHALVGSLKDQLAAAKDIAPYAATIVSFVPGIGTGVAAAIAAGAALAEGKPIDQALEEAIKAAIPGGAIAAAGFELAKKAASGENVGKAALESARVALPPEAQKAFDIGLAVVSGKQLQSALVSAVASLAPGELKQILDVGAHAIQNTPGLATLANSLSSDVAKQGLQLAAGALGHAGVNEAQIRAMRSKITGDMLSGFDSALKSQAPHFPWIANIVTAPATAAKTAPAVITQAAKAVAAQPPPVPSPHEPTKSVPKPNEPAKKPNEPAKKPNEPTRSVATATPAPAAGLHNYPPYPVAGAVSGPPATYSPYPGTLSDSPHSHPHSRPHASRVHTPAHPWPMYGTPHNPEASTSISETCHVWGGPIEMPMSMERAARAALAASSGRPTTVRGPDGGLYLFTYEGGSLIARPCAS